MARTTTVKAAKAAKAARAAGDAAVATASADEHDEHALCTCTTTDAHREAGLEPAPHEYGVPGCKFGRGGDGKPVAIDPETGEMVPEPSDERRARLARIDAAKRGEEDGDDA